MLSSIPVNLIRQWCYCPRVVYYQELMGYKVSYPLWVEQGEKFHEEEARLWQRRNLSRFGLEEGRLHLNCQGNSEKYGIHGIADMVIETETSVYPVEFKLSTLAKRNGAVLQLLGYGLIFEEFFAKPCLQGFLAEGRNRLYKVDFTSALSMKFRRKILEIREMISKGRKPDSSATEAQCSNCEYMNYCNDRF